MNRKVTTEKKKNLSFSSSAEINMHNIARLQYTEITGVNYIEFKEADYAFTTHTYSCQVL